jgi:hypothetical protein
VQGTVPTALWQGRNAVGVFRIKSVENLKQSATSTALYLRHNLPPCRQELERAAPAVPIR